jgi:hypothetical protein
VEGEVRVGAHDAVEHERRARLDSSTSSAAPKNQRVCA